MECENCGLDLSDGTTEVDLGTSWVTVYIECECGARYFQDMQLAHFSREDD